MVTQKALTRLELISVLKELDLATRKDLEKFATKNDLELSNLKLEKKLTRKINAAEKKIMASMAKLALSTPTRKEFVDLKTAVGIASN